MRGSSDITIHEFNFGHNRRYKGALVFIKGMVDMEAIHKNILQPLMYDSLLLQGNVDMDFTKMDTIRKNLISITESQKVTRLGDLLDNLLAGSSILLVNGSKEALAIKPGRRESRSIEEPGTETVVRGPREGFVENVDVNIALIRRKIKDTDLCVEKFVIGDKSKTDIYIVYLKNIANPKLIEEIRIRLERIKTDAILESGYIEQFIEDSPYSIFPTISNSEKPDKVAAKILEGRAAIMVDGTPFVLVVPMVFVESFQSAEDYYARPFLASVIRIIRFLSYIISTLGPAIYVALTVFHQELIPTQLLISIAEGRERVPFPAIMEAFLMLFIFDILREAGVRLPKSVGQTVGIVGALVLGQASVEAGLISPIMVIVVSTTAIASFVVPAQTDSGTILRYIYLILAGIAGGFGVIMGLLATLMHLASLRSFGTPYLWPIVPLDFSGLKDVFIRMPLWIMPERPKAIVWDDVDSYSQSPGLMPSPYKKDSNDSQ
ncbi:MAG TPA: spore germination protein [Candidatus Atribacteria bacterium]|nr:spore germination protein [Candidatus Atribacteria bacterium]HPT78517.1 spore germination protein [Candidatus Atribacteria bacterium]